jgi:hypothetical protein
MYPPHPPITGNHRKVISGIVIDSEHRPEHPALLFENVTPRSDVSGPSYLNPPLLDALTAQNVKIAANIALFLSQSPWFRTFCQMFIRYLTYLF